MNPTTLTEAGWPCQPRRCQDSRQQPGFAISGVLGHVAVQLYGEYRGNILESIEFWGMLYSEHKGNLLTILSGLGVWGWGPW